MLTNETMQKIEKVVALVKQGIPVRQATKKAKISLGYYYAVRNQMPPSEEIVPVTRVLAPLTLHVKFDGIEASGDPMSVCEFIKEYRK
jgi:hypothetical protein